MNELKGCPFCGEKPLYEKLSQCGGMEYSYEDEVIYCPTCGVSVYYPGHYASKNHNMTIQDKWNYLANEVCKMVEEIEILKKPMGTIPRIVNAIISKISLKKDYETDGELIFELTLHTTEDDYQISWAAETGTEVLEAVLVLVGADSWEELQGKYVRVEECHGGIRNKIGHITSDTWVEI